jgi:ribonuclease HI
VGGREDHTTNNRMELSAAIAGLRSISDKDASVEVFTDSRYLINGITKWVEGWMRKGWITAAKTEVENRDLWEDLYEVSAGRRIGWNYVGGHSGIAGNERCDEIATAFADGKDARLYEGPASSYGIDILDMSHGPAALAQKKSGKSRSGAKAYSYVSLVKGVFKTHATWAECEARVKGVAGAKFKKAFSPGDERDIAKSWGL